MKVMKVRLLAKPAPVPYELALDRLKRCGVLVDEYMQAQRDKNKNAALTARLGISLFAPTGIYARGGDQSGELFAVFGVKKTKSRVNRERVFYVPHIKVHRSGEFAGEWEISWLIESEGFLFPVCRDGYHGARFIRVGDILHA